MLLPILLLIVNRLFGPNRHDVFISKLQTNRFNDAIKILLTDLNPSLCLLENDFPVLQKSEFLSVNIKKN